MGFRSSLKKKVKSTLRRVVDQVVVRDTEEKPIERPPTTKNEVQKSREEQSRESSKTELQPAPESADHTQQEKNDIAVAPTTSPETSDTIPETDSELQQESEAEVETSDSEPSTVHTDPPADGSQSSEIIDSSSDKPEEKTEGKESATTEENNDGLQGHPVSPNLKEEKIEENPKPEEPEKSVEKVELTEEEKKAAAEKKHLAKTRKGLLKKIKDNGGEMSLRDLHAHSEKRYFVGHQRFSVLMESMVEEEHVEYSFETGIVVLGCNADTILSS